ncbi:MAG: outer membrane beta-barrel protein [Marinifilaceae bacterium]
MKKYIFITIALLTFCFSAKAQMLNVNYQIGVPFSKTHDFISNASFRGADIEYHSFLGNNMSIGLALGWNVYYKKYDNKTQDFFLNHEEYTITGKQYRYINTVPLLLIPRYYFTDNSALFRPYLGVGVGTCWSEYKLEVGQYSSRTSRWEFQVSPEIGTLIHINDQMAVNLGARYNFATKAANGRVPQMSTLMFNIGICFIGSNY